MPLDKSCEQYKSNLVFVWPIIGNGWCRIDPKAPPFQPGDEMEPPTPFHARVLEFHYLADKIAAGIGIVEESEHPFNKEWVAFCIRDRGADLYNLTTSPGKYNVAIGNTKPTIKIDLDFPMPQWMQFEGPPVASGFGYIAVSDTWITRKYEWLMKDRKAE